MSGIDWSKAGKRLRHSPPVAGGRNPDWNFRASRWKDQADYLGEEMSIEQVVATVSCVDCAASRYSHCIDSAGKSMADGPHARRRRHAAEKVIANDKA